MTELERERGEFEKWADKDAEIIFCVGLQNQTENGEYEDLETMVAWAGWQASQQSTLRRVRAILDNSIIIDADKPLVRDVLAAIEREFGGVEK